MRAYAPPESGRSHANSASRDCLSVFLRVFPRGRFPMGSMRTRGSQTFWLESSSGQARTDIRGTRMARPEFSSGSILPLGDGNAAPRNRDPPDGLPGGRGLPLPSDRNFRSCRKGCGEPPAGGRQSGGAGQRGPGPGKPRRRRGPRAPPGGLGVTAPPRSPADGARAGPEPPVLTADLAPRGAVSSGRAGQTALFLQGQGRVASATDEQPQFHPVLSPPCASPTGLHPRVNAAGVPSPAARSRKPGSL